MSKAKTHPTTYVAYYRVSTDKQGASGLGLDAQRAAVLDHINGNGDKLIAEYTEVESGKRNDRPQLAEALKLCRKEKAKLVIAKLDRLARNVAFISNLMESGVDFVAVDMPDANRLTVHILAAVAEHERDMISQRTKDALAEAKAKGTKLGNPRKRDSIDKDGNLKIGRARAGKIGRQRLREKADQHASKVSTIIEGIKEKQGKATLQSIADALNNMHIPTARGGDWHPATVRNILRRAGQKSPVCVSGSGCHSPNKIPWRKANTK